MSAHQASMNFSDAAHARIAILKPPPRGCIWLCVEPRRDPLSARVVYRSGRACVHASIPVAGSVKGSKGYVVTDAHSGCAIAYAWKYQDERGTKQARARAVAMADAAAPLLERMATDERAWVELAAVLNRKVAA